MKNEYNYSAQAEPHVGRTREILSKYPEIKSLMGRNPKTIFYILLILVIQVTVAFLLKDVHWAIIILVAWLFGAFVNHASFVLLHECTHNLIFRNKTANRIAGILCDLPNGFPSSAGFRKYHLKHHAFQGHYHIDADIPSRWEARLIGRSFLGKAIWLLFFPLFQGLRPARLKEIQFNSKWIWSNLVAVLLFDLAIGYVFGWGALLYILLSFIFSVGLHPVGARWIQEHYLVAPPQETYSYYGPLNKVAFNVGYHNEHHDFSFVPWNNLPRIREMAPEFYNNLYYHTSWSKLMWMFLTDGDLSLFSRTLRDNKGGLAVSPSTDTDYLQGLREQTR